MRELLKPELSQVLRTVQNDLFDVGANLCNQISPDPKYPPLRIGAEYVTRLEDWCGELNARLSALDSCSLPGGTAGAALLHQARTIARREDDVKWVSGGGR